MQFSKGKLLPIGEERSDQCVEAQGQAKRWNNRSGHFGVDLQQCLGFFDDRRQTIREVANGELNRNIHKMMLLNRTYSQMYHVSRQWGQNRWIHNAEKALHRRCLQLQTKWTGLFLQQNPRLDDGSIEECGHNGGQQGNRNVAADVSEFAESQSIPIVSINIHSSGSPKSTQHTWSKLDGRTL